MTTTQAKIDKARADLKILEDRLLAEEATALEPEHELAAKLHDILCTSNHIDVCSWHYEVHQGVADWSKSTEHYRWLGRAKKITTFCCLNNIAVENVVPLAKLIF